MTLLLVIAGFMAFVFGSPGVAVKASRCRSSTDRFQHISPYAAVKSLGRCQQVGTDDCHITNHTRPFWSAHNFTHISPSVARQAGGSPCCDTCDTAGRLMPARRCARPRSMLGLARPISRCRNTAGTPERKCDAPRYGLCRVASPRLAVQQRYAG